MKTSLDPNRLPEPGTVLEVRLRGQVVSVEVSETDLKIVVEVDSCDIAVLESNLELSTGEWVELQAFIERVVPEPFVGAYRADFRDHDAMPEFRTRPDLGPVLLTLS